MTNSPDFDATNLQAEVLRWQGMHAAADLELERAHRLLDEWGLPREAESEDGESLIELSLTGRLELLPDGDPED